jgi:hypothetical protein
MGPGDEHMFGRAVAACTSRSRPLRRALSTMAARRARLLASLTVTLVLALVASAAAGTASPRWELISNHGPTNVPRTHATPQQWTITEPVLANVGRFKIEVEVEGHTARKTKFIKADASAAEVQTELRELVQVGTNVTVTGGPSEPHPAGEWSYVVSFVGGLEGLNLPTVEVETFESTIKERKEVEEKSEEPVEAEPELEETQKASRNTVIYQIIPKNLGAAPTSGLITVTDKLPPGVVTEETETPGEPPGPFWSCTPQGEGHTEVKCTSEKVVNPDAQAETIFIKAYVDPTLFKEGDKIVNEPSITGGGAPLTQKAEADSALVSETPAQFGIHNFKAASFGPEGVEDTVAGDHPYAATTTFFFNTVNKYAPWEQEYEVLTPGNLKDADVVLPEGFIGNPVGPFIKGVPRPRCSQPEFLLGAKGQPGEQTHLGCPANTQVGTAFLLVNAFNREPTVVPVYNLTPPAGVPAEFGFLFANVPVRLDAHVRRIEGKYRLTVLSPDINEAFNISGVSLSLWGVPKETSHDAERNQTLDHAVKGAKDTEEVAGEPVERPFLTNPADCAVQAKEAPITVLHYDQWELPGANNAQGEPLLGMGESTWHEASKEAPAVKGCDKLTFKPAVESGPRPVGEGGSTQVSAPSGYQFNLEIPQIEEVNKLGTPQLKDTVVTLPPGVSLSPSAANGLKACSPGEIELESTTPGNCPEASQVGEVHIHSELLEEELVGKVLIGEPECSPCSEQNELEGKLFKLYIEAEGPHSGVRIKLPGSAIAGTKATEREGGLKLGQVRSTFANNPQLPFTKLTLVLKGGPRATLANPATCGPVETNTLLTPWSLGENAIPGNPVAEVKSGYGTTVSYDGAGAGCPSSLPFAPTFAAGTENAQAGAYSPFVTIFKRSDDREQTFKGIVVHTPPGLLGKIKGVDKCEASPVALEKEEAQCPANSRIATATTAAGSGSEPFVVSGPVYLTGASSSEASGTKVEGPFGLDIVVPAKAGPFNLGTVVVHAIIQIDKSTSAITITSDPVPQSIDGVPFRVQKIAVRVDRPEFMFNPTNCEAGAGHEVTASLTGNAQGQAGETDASANAATPLTATGCAALPFNPHFTAESDGKFSKHTGARLTVKVTAQPGEANIRKVELQLPEALPSQLETLHKACPDYIFEANPATCPPGSTVGSATAVTPLLNSPLSGPAILVSHANLAFPDLVYLLQGEGVHIELVGNTNIEHGITYSKFETVPDAPISSFETVIPRGEHALLTAYGNLCEKELIAPTTLTSQSNKVIKENTRISVAECPPIVKVMGTKASAKQLLVTVNVTKSGTLKISGHGITTVVKRGVSAGTHQVPVPLTAAGKAAARKHKKLSLQVTITVGRETGSTTTTAKA